MQLFLTFVIIDVVLLVLSLPLLLTGSVRWARLAALIPLGLGALSLAIGVYAHTVSAFPGYRLVLVLVFAAAITAFICVLTARLLLGFGPKQPAK